METYGGLERVMGRKPIVDKRVTMTAMVHPATLEAIKAEAKTRGVSQGVVIDEAVSLLRDIKGATAMLDDVHRAKEGRAAQEARQLREQADALASQQDKPETLEAPWAHAIPKMPVLGPLTFRRNK
jgi:hypothetical protein